MAKKRHQDDPAKWDFKRARNGDEHIRNCKDGYDKNVATAKENQVEVHHLLCVHACSDETLDTIPDEHVEYIWACMAITDWNINGEGNNIGLPRKWAYINDPNDSSGWDGLPCHQVDHDIYLTKVEDYVIDKIWKTLQKGKKGKKCEQITGENIAQKFNDGSDEWKTFLKDRGAGADSGGMSTKEALEYCLSGDDDPEKESQWFVPFSMAPDGEARVRAKPPANKKLKRAGFLNIEED